MVRSYLTLARWLGPWAPAEGAPPVARRELPIAGPRPFRARLFQPIGRAPRRAFLVAPGLHHAGPDDPRMDRFCAVLAASGAAVLAPAIPDFLALRVTPEAADDFARALDAFGHRPTVFSISFGSLLALRLAAARPDQIERVVVFGGYADFAAAIRFSLSGQGDPLNRPVVFINLIDQLGAGEHREPLLAAWRRFVEATWGRPEMRTGDRWRTVARAIAADLPDAATSASPRSRAPTSLTSRRARTWSVARSTSSTASTTTSSRSSRRICSAAPCPAAAST
jgi:pimeloyl-ACP methyl ester carboxylesterase